ncbi:MAG: tRNA 2-thiouridine(34) synthase MnmA, partial [Hyphomicrobiales bacterium]
MACPETAFRLCAPRPEGLDPSRFRRRPMLNSLDLPRRPADTRVVVAMSGGVDSS